MTRCSGPERRRDTRVMLDRPVKVWCGHSGRYLLGRTVDISAGGVCVQLSDHASLVLGQPVRVGIPESPRVPLLRETDFQAATVLRTLRLGGTLTAALQFDEPHELRQAS